MALLVGAVLLIRSFHALQLTDPGFDPAPVVTTRLSAPAARYPAGPVLAGFYDRVVERVKALPGVESASVVDWLPVSGFGASAGFRLTSSRPADGQGRWPSSAWSAPSISRRSACGSSPDVRSIGRDVEGAPHVVAINESLARTWFGAENPIGRSLTLDRGGPLEVQIVGVVADVRELALKIAPAAGIYAPKTQQPWMRHETRDLVIRTRTDTATLAPAIRAVLRELEPDMPHSPLQRMDDVVAGALARPGFYASAVAASL